jgi:hypothetical protein
LFRTWRAPDERVASLGEALRTAGGIVSHGGPYDPWDFEVRGGVFGRTRVLMAVEDVGSGNQLVRLRVRPQSSSLAWRVFGTLAVAASGAAAGGERNVALGLGFLAFIAVWKMFRQCGATMFAVQRAAAACGLVESGQGEAACDPGVETACAFDAKDGRL